MTLDCNGILLYWGIFVIGLLVGAVCSAVAIMRYEPEYESE